MQVRQRNLARRFPWHAVVAVLLLGMLGLSLSARSDTYNFYFDKKKGEKGAEASGPEETPAAPAPAAVVPPQTVAVPAGTQAPIVIHNTNNVGTAPAAPVAPVAAAPAPAAAPSAAQVEAGFSRPSGAGWKMSLTAMAFLQEFDYGYVSSGELTTYRSLRETWGGLLSLGYNFSRTFGVNFYGGARVAPTVDKTFYHAGVDLEITPFRIPVSQKVDLFELGLIVGGSTAMAADGNIGSLHAGARVNINFAPEFGITASGRANLGYILLEGGIIARL